MDDFTFFLGGVLPYVTGVTFVAGMGYNFYVWFKTPQPGKMTLSPWPEGTMLKNILSEVFLFPGLFKSDKVLWSISWVFHGSLALVFLGHFRVFSDLIDGGLIAMGVSANGVNRMSSVLGGAAGIVMLATAALLIVRRMAVQRAREVSVFSDYFALLLLLGIIVTGDAMRFSPQHFDLGQTRIWAYSLLAFRPVVPQSAAFLVHATLAQMLILYIPFSKIMHFGGIFFTQPLVHRR